MDWFKYEGELNNKSPLFTDDVRRAYLVCALFSDWMDEYGETPSVYDLLRPSYEEAGRDVLRFIKAAEDKGIDVTQFDAERVGHDLWWSRNGHGTGFFDREEVYGEKNAETLQELARSMKQVNVFPVAEGKWEIS